MRIMKPNFGLTRWLDDELQVVLQPHAWVAQRERRTVAIEDILPGSLIAQYSLHKGVLTHNAYLNNDNAANQTDN